MMSKTKFLYSFLLRFWFIWVTREFFGLRTGNIDSFDENVSQSPQHSSSPTKSHTVTEDILYSWEYIRQKSLAVFYTHPSMLFSCCSLSKRTPLFVRSNHYLQSWGLEAERVPLSLELRLSWCLSKEYSLLESHSLWERDELSQGSSLTRNTWRERHTFAVFCLSIFSVRHLRCCYRQSLAKGEEHMKHTPCFSFVRIK